MNKPLHARASLDQPEENAGLAKNPPNKPPKTVELEGAIAMGGVAFDGRLTVENPWYRRLVAFFKNLF